MNRKEALKDIFIRRLDKDQLKEKWGPEYGKVRSLTIVGTTVAVSVIMAPWAMWDLGYFDPPNRTGRRMTADEIRMKHYYNQCMQEEKQRGKKSPAAADTWCTAAAGNKLEAYKDSVFNAQQLQRLNATWDDLGQ